MKRLASSGAVALALAGMVTACETTPVTDRSQLVLISEDQATALGADAYRQILAEKQISDDPGKNEMVNRIGRRIAAVSDDPGYDWEFNVLVDPTANAFALPGGKVAVNTGLFDVARTEGQLAAVMAHEVGHAVARHSAERLSRQMVIETGLGAAGMTSQTAAQFSGLLAQAATLGLVLPFSRKQEAEADEIGLIYMARAGYDPREAVELWRNIDAQAGQRAPEFLSTHPAPGNRIEHLQSIMPKALAIYRQQNG
ncbi:M48 family metallopeptidase [Oceanibacterium hippocampi]|uniref:TPR repeat-containing protein YfgC n=1 Tax=Oceanibacterium hippocampi TaxID=745714 RepID=A0A1Y5TVJ4_9PROT|nr:M48 family metallopeptidase [Oceanibacterium hippocampi]SLN73781.1 TPR repeat-containing protein YfgC precursor [Oceanibacterium hippocampi]